MSHQPLPHAWVERLFARFSATWGAQRLATMFPVDSHADVKALWAEQLGRFEPETLRAALQSLTDSGREWPPTLPEFIAACQQAAVARRQHAPAALLDIPRASPEVAAEQLANVERIASAVKPRKGREWAQKILDRAASGENVPICVRQMAERALDLEVTA
jgi:hypothetical protein